MRICTLTPLLLLIACSNTDTINHTGADGSVNNSDAAPVVNPASACPHIDLGTQVPIAWNGSTVGLPNHVESTRLEWRSAPDDSLSFTAPEDGDYVVYFESAESGFGVSAREYPSGGTGDGPFFTPDDCPVSGQTKIIDGVYSDNQPNYPLQLTAGQTILLWVSGAYWADSETTTYTLRVDKVAAANQKRVFVTSGTFDGNLGGLTGADQKCQQHANDAGLGGDWIAWLSTPTANAIDRLSGNGPWVRVDGELVFSSKTAIADPFTDPETGLWLDESGNFLASDRIWTGTSSDGQYVSSIGDSCQSWTSGAMSDQARIGQVGRTNSGAWTGYSFTSCDQSNTRLICFEQ